MIPFGGYRNLKGYSFENSNVTTAVVMFTVFRTVSPTLSFLKYLLDIQNVISYNKRKGELWSKKKKKGKCETKSSETDFFLVALLRSFNMLIYVASLKKMD